MKDELSIPSKQLMCPAAHGLCHSSPTLIACHFSTIPQLKKPCCYQTLLFALVIGGCNLISDNLAFESIGCKFTLVV